MTVVRILVPYNFAPHERKALDFLVSTFVGKEDAKITLFHAYTPLPVVDMDASPELAKMRGAMVTLSKELAEKESSIKATKKYLVDSGFSEDQLDYVFREKEKSVSDEIIDVVTKGHYKVIVLSPTTARVTRLFSRSTYSKLISSLKDITICIAI
jgi:hypothetical protein